MRLLPYESWEIESPLTVDELVAGMAFRIEPQGWDGLVSAGAVADRFRAESMQVDSESVV